MRVPPAVRILPVLVFHMFALQVPAARATVHIMGRVGNIGRIGLKIDHLWAVLRAMGAAPGGPLVELSLHTTAVALGVVAGFVSQIPGGLLVREWVAGELLEPAYGPSVALVSTVILRLVLLVSELLVSIILYAAGWRRLRKASAAARVDYHAAPQR